MATDLERLVVQLSADVTKYQNAMNRAQGITNRTARQIEGRFQRMNRVAGVGFGGLATRLGGAFAAGALIREASQLVDAATRIDNALKVAGLSGAELEKVYNKLRDSAIRNAAPIEDLVTLYSRASQAANNLGASQEDLDKFTDTVAVSLRVSGKSAQEASGALLQLSQVLGGSVVQAQEYNSLIDGAYPLLQAAAAGLKEAGGEVSKLTQLVKSGQLPVRAFFDAILAGSGVLAERVKTSEFTISQAMGNLRTSLIDAAREFEAATNAGKSFAGGINNIAAAVAGFDITGFIQKIRDARVELERLAKLAGNARMFEELAEALLGRELTVGQPIDLEKEEAEDKIDNLQRQVEILKDRIEANKEMSIDTTEAQQQLDRILETIRQAKAELADPTSGRGFAVGTPGDPNALAGRSTVTTPTAKFEAWTVLGKTSEGRLIVVNPEEGGLSSEFTQTVNDPRGGFMNVPTLFSGKPVPIDEAVDRIIKNGFKDPETSRAIENFKTIEEAIEAAIARSLSLSVDPNFRAAENLFNEGPSGNTVSLKDYAAIEDAGKELKNATVDLIKRFEGFIASPKWDVNALRAGYGSDTVTLDDGSVQKVTAGITVSVADANRDLVRRIGEFQEGIVRDIGAARFSEFNEDQQAALTSIAYNYGSLPQRIVEAIKTGNAETIGNAIRGLGSDNGGVNRTRRNTEADIFESGVPEGLREEIELRREQLRVVQELQAAGQTETARIQLETALVGASNAERERQMFIFERLNELQSQGIPITDALRASVEAEAQARFGAVASYDATIAAQEAAAESAERLRQKQEELQYAQQEIAGAFQGALKGLITDLAHGKDATEALLDAVSRLADRLLDIALDMLFQNLFGGLAGGLGGGGLLAGLFHSGGKAGAAVASRTVSPLMFAGAQRYHSGGLAGLKPGEVPAILQRGELVLPRSQVRSMARSSQGSQNVDARTTVVNTFDAGSFLSEALSRPEGVKVVLNAVRAQPGAFRAAINA